MALTKVKKHTVRLTSTQVFNYFRDYNGYSVRTLTEAVDTHLASMARKNNGGRAVKRADRPTVSKTTIGNLASGARDTCSADVAKAIAAVFKVPANTLFTSKITTVTREVRSTK